MTSFPPDLLYHPEHMWVRVETGSVVVAGITDFAQESLEAIEYIELPEAGTEVTAGEALGRAESAKVLSDLVAPVSGRVVAVNTRALERPELVNGDPYGEGWLVVIEATGTVETWGLLTADDYRRLVE